MRFNSEKLHYIELFVSCIFVIMNAGVSLIFFYIWNNIAYISIIYESFFLLFVILYALRKKARDRSKQRWYNGIMHLTFVALAISYIALFATSGIISFGMLISIIIELEAFTLFFMLFLPIFFLAFAGVYLMRNDKKERGGMLMLFFIVFCMLMLYFFLLTSKQVFHADDEELMKFESVKMLLNGTNPYSASISPLLYKYIGSIGSTITTTNGVIGVMDYPALFFLAFVPFYFAASPVIGNLNNIFMPLQSCVFMFILVATIALSLEKKYLSVPNLGLLTLFMFAILDISSITTYLMLALMILAYTRIESKYAWIILGICASIQEELWLPVLLLLVYSANRQGIKKALMNAAGALVIFLAINFYFIVINPAVYYNSVFATLNQPMMPFSPAPFAFFFLKEYQIPLSAFTKIFEILSVLIVFVFAYLNEKRLVFIFSFIPFLMLTHTLVSYYTFFLFLMFFSFLLEEKKGPVGVVEKQLKKYKPIFFLGVVLLVALIVFVAVSSHSSYERNFGIALKNQSAFSDSVNNDTIINYTLDYMNMSNRTIYVFAFIYSNSNAGFAGLINQSIIANSQKCGGYYRCLINVNKIVLPSNATEYPVSMRIPWTANGTKSITYASVVVYNDDYFYVGNVIETPKS
jgi:hypothetical protein